MLKIKKSRFNYSIEEFVSDYALYKNGDLYADQIPLEDKPRKIAYMFGRLVEILANKKIIDVEDIVRIADTYEDIALVDTKDNRF